MAGNLLDDDAFRRLEAVVLRVESEVRQLRQTRDLITASPFETWLAQSSGDIAQGAEGTFTLYTRGDPDNAKGSESVMNDGNGDPITVIAYVRLGDYTADSWAYVAWVDGGFEVWNTECP